MPSRTSYEERERRREQFYQTHKNVKRPNASNSDSFFGFVYDPSRKKSVGPLALICYSFTILFFLMWLFSRAETDITSLRIESNGSSMQKITLPNRNKIYDFKMEQFFDSYSVPQYSELEVELLDAQFGHVYTFYKDLWQEYHPNDEGGSSLYSDKEMNFELAIEKKGTYYLRVVSHNGNTGPIAVKIVSRTFGGGMYYGFYALFFAGLSLITYLGKDLWGTPLQLLEAIPDVKELKTNKSFVFCLFIALSLFIGCIIINVSHYGYASGGDERVIPTYFFNTNNVIYIG